MIPFVYCVNHIVKGRAPDKVKKMYGYNIGTKLLPFKISYLPLYSVTAYVTRASSVNIPLLTLPCCFCNVGSGSNFVTGQDGIGYTDIKLSLDGPRVDNSSVMQYWSLEEGIYDNSPFNMDKKVLVFVPSLTFITFNDRKAPSTFATLVGYGWVVIGL